MQIVQLGDSSLGDEVRHILRSHGDEVTEAHDRHSLHKAVDDLGEPDWLVSAGCRFILRAGELASARHNCNVHTSLLPWGKGANPNVWALACREPAGVTIHEMVPDVDAGPIYAQQPVDATFGDTAETLYRRLHDTAVSLFAAAWPAIRDGNLDAVPQPGGGSLHRVADFESLCRVDLDQRVTWREALDVLRALTFPPHRNLIVHDGECRWHVEVKVDPVD